MSESPERRRERIMLAAVGKAMKAVKTQNVRHAIELRRPKVTVNNDVKTPEVHVTVDLDAMAKAIEKLAEAIAAQGKTLASLAKAVAERKAPVVNVEPKFDVPKFPVEVKVAAPIIKVEIPETKKKRSIKIKHEDGSKSEITEE